MCNNISSRISVVVVPNSIILISDWINFIYLFKLLISSWTNIGSGVLILLYFDNISVFV